MRHAHRPGSTAGPKPSSPDPRDGQFAMPRDKLSQVCGGGITFSHRCAQRLHVAIISTSEVIDNHLVIEYRVAPDTARPRALFQGRAFKHGVAPALTAKAGARPAISGCPGASTRSANSKSQP